VHIDRSPYFSKTLRIHLPVETNESVWMLCAGQAYQMLPGEIWALNNSAQHGVWNRHPSLSRTHLICDFLPTAELNRLIAEGDRTLGRPIGEVEAVSPPVAH
jgi:Aspartyl/Asparaginyl beta-hydroxylase